jgi:hypothetical protein
MSLPPVAAGMPGAASCAQFTQFPKSEQEDSHGFDAHGLDAPVAVGASGAASCLQFTQFPEPEQDDPQGPGALWW